MISGKEKNFRFLVLSLILPCLFLLFAFSQSRADSYMGQDPGAAWRKKADERIDKIRKDKLAVSVRSSNGASIAGADVHVRMQRHAFAFGSAVGAKELMGKGKDSEKYRKIVETHYNKAVLENDLKWESWENGKAKPLQMEQKFDALKWLNDRGIKVRGHYISWGPLDGNAQYEKLKDQPETFRMHMFEHIKEEVPAVGNRVSEWDVLNHPVGWGLTLGGLYGKGIYVDICLLARKLNPDARLYINERGILPSNKESYRLRDDYEKLIRYLLAQGAPLDGIGFMGHFDYNTLTPPEDILKVLDRFAAFGLPLQVTEFDVRFGEKSKAYDFSEEELQLQADYTRDFMSIMFSYPAVEGIVMWGFWEGRHWYPGAALYRMDWSIKPNGKVWEDLVFKKWWTDVQGKTDKKGLFQTRGFLGDYEVEVKYKGRIKVVPVKLEKGATRLQITLPD